MLQGRSANGRRISRIVHGAGVLASAGFLLITGTAGAADQIVDASGVVHSIVVEARLLPSGAPAGTRLVHRLQKADGTLESRLMPGTDDVQIESDPVVAISTYDGRPYAFWVRSEITDSEILFAVFDGFRWSSAAPLTANTWDDWKPSPVGGRSGYVHVMWATGSPAQGSSSFYEVTLDSKGLPFRLPLEIRVAAKTASPGQANPESSLADCDILFAFDASPKTGPRRVTVYGGTDEPIPTLRRVDFVLSGSSAAIDHVKLERVGSRPLLLVRQQKSLLYTIGSSTGWSPLFTIGLDSISEDRAEILIKEMVLRTDGTLTSGFTPD